MGCTYHITETAVGVDVHGKFATGRLGTIAKSLGGHPARRAPYACSGKQTSLGAVANDGKAKIGDQGLVLIIYEDVRL